MSRAAPIAVVALFLGAPACAQTQTATTVQIAPTRAIYTVRERNVDWQPCGDGVFILSIYPNGVMNAVPMNGGPTKRGPGPYDYGAPIIVLGWSATQWLSNPEASGSWIIGSGHVGANGVKDGPDEFAHGGGVGMSHGGNFFPAGFGFPQGGRNWIESRFDVYGSCGPGASGSPPTKQIMDVTIYYTTRD